ncbi:MAG: PepSY-associated TM helix domain-containing protein [bacterium]
MFRKLHRFLGIAAALFIFYLCLSGLLLNHPSIFTNKRSSSDPSILSVFSSPLNDGSYWVQRSDGFFISDPQFNTWSQLPLLYPAKDIFSFITTSSGKSYLAFKHGLILYLKNIRPVMWELVTYPPDDFSSIRSFTCMKDTLVLKTERALYLLSPTQSKWIKIEDYPYTFYSFVKGLHTGYFFKPILLIFHDFSAVAMIVLIITGLSLYFTKRPF